MARPTADKPQATVARRRTSAERAAELTEDERVTRREVRRAFVWTLGGCLLSLGVALGLMGWGVYTKDPAFGQIALLGGLIVGYGGIAISIARFYLRGEHAGWWA
jgi:hypothetical protein